MNNNNYIIKTGLVQKCSPRGMGTMWKLVFLELSNDSLKYYNTNDFNRLYPLTIPIDIIIS